MNGKKLTPALGRALGYVIESGERGITSWGVSNFSGVGINGVRCALNRLQARGLIECMKGADRNRTEECVWIATPAALEVAGTVSKNTDEALLPDDKQVKWLRVGEWCGASVVQPRSVFELGGFHA